MLDNRADHAFRVSNPEDDRSRMIKQIKGLLNKITPEKYTEIANQIVTFFEPTTSDAIVPLIFEKALNELTFAEMYADLFRDLWRKVATCAQSHTTFLMALMLRCNLELTKALASDEAQAEQEQNQPDTDRKKLKRSVGISQFIGELFVREMLKEDFLYKISTKLLHLTESSSENVKQTEAEVACKLIETAGACWEASHTRFKSEIIPRFEELNNNHPKPRIRVLCLNLLECRNRGWQQRFNKQKPKRLDQEGNLRQSVSPARSTSPLNLRDGLARLGLYGSNPNTPNPESPLRSGDNPYGDMYPQSPDPYRSSSRSNTPPPPRGVVNDPYGSKRNSQTPPRVMPFIPGCPLDIGSAPTSPLPLAHNVPLPPSAPPSPQPAVYQHNPYSYTSPLPSPAPVSPGCLSPQLSWPEAPQMNWQQSTMQDQQQYPQQMQWSGQDQQMQWQGTDQQMQWQPQDQQIRWPQQQDQMGWQSPDTQQQMQWSQPHNQLWTPDSQPNSGMMNVTPPMSPAVLPMMPGNQPQQSLPLSPTNQHLPIAVPPPVVRQPIPIVDPKKLDPAAADPIVVKVGAPKPKSMPTTPTTGGDAKVRGNSPALRPLPVDSAAVDVIARPRPNSPAPTGLPLDPPPPLL
jgi:translation initiation factor 4G